MDKVPDWQLIIQKSKPLVNHLATRALFVGIGIGGLVGLVGLSMMLFTDSLIMLLLSPVCLGLGFFFGLLGVVRSRQILGWPLLLVTATVLERRKVTFRGVRYYVRLHVLQAETFHLNGAHIPAAFEPPELDYTTSRKLFNHLKEGETVTLICAPRLHEIVAQVNDGEL
jgi:hypothetical protein